MSSFEDRIAVGMAELSRFFIGSRTLGETLTAVSELARDALGADMAGITMLVEGRPRTGVFTDPSIPDLDSRQYDTGHGPCLDAFRNQLVLRIEDTSTEERWPEFAAACAAVGIRSTMSLPMGGSEEPLGAMNLYFRTAVPPDEVSVEEAIALTAQASTVLANAQAYNDARELSENLHTALASRANIDRAVGILMADGGLSADDAFQLLVRASQRTNRKVREIATELVAAAQTRTSRRAPGAGPATTDPDSTPS